LSGEVYASTSFQLHSPQRIPQGCSCGRCVASTQAGTEDASDMAWGQGMTGPRWHEAGIPRNCRPDLRGPIGRSRIGRTPPRSGQIGSLRWRSNGQPNPVTFGRGIEASKSVSSDSRRSEYEPTRTDHCFTPQRLRAVISLRRARGRRPSP